MESLKKKSSDALCTSGMFVIEVNIVSLDNIWLLDTGYGSHICTNMQGLRNSRKLSRGEFDKHVGNGARVATLAIGTYVLTLPSGLVLHLDDCFYVLVLTKKIIYVSYLNWKVFHLKFGNNGYSIMLLVHYAMVFTY